MTSTLDTAAAVTMLPIDQVHESPWNPRRFYPEAALAELTESMRQSGFRPWLPLMVRPREEGGYEIGAGHRRSRAARAAGFGEVPCIVKPMTDEEFLDVLNFDNTGREDVHPLHEAAGWRTWMEKTGGTVPDIAARIGQSKEYVYQRLKYSSLIDEAQEAFLNGDITAGHAILIARLRPDDQRDMLKECLPPDWNPDRKISVRQLAEFISMRVHLDMASACFHLADGSLVPGVGSCAACSKRTINEPVVYGADCEDKCTDRACFQAKVASQLDRIRAKLRAEGTVFVEISRRSWRSPREGVLGSKDYYEVEVDNDPDAGVVGLIVDGREAGMMIRVLVEVSHLASAAPSSSSAEPSESGDAETAAERRNREEAERERLKQERRAIAAREFAVRRAILEAIGTKVGGLTRADLAELLSFCLDDESHVGIRELCLILDVGIKLAEGDDDYEAANALRAKLPKLAESELFHLAVLLPVGEDLAGLSSGEFHAHFEIPGSAKIAALAKRFRVDAVKIRQRVEAELAAAEGGASREVEQPTKKGKKPGNKQPAAE